MGNIVEDAEPKINSNCLKGGKMKKYILFLPILVLLITSVIAVSSDDFSFNAKDSLTTDNLKYKVSMSVWHDKGKTPTYHPFSWFWHGDIKNHWSNGIPASGKGILEIIYETNERRVTLNLNLEEKEIISNINGIIIVNNKATGTFWTKGKLPEKVSHNLTYYYNTNTKTASVLGFNNLIVQ